MKLPSLLIHVAMVLGLWVLKGGLCEEELCPSGWLEFEEHCYYFSKVRETKSWDGAVYDCEAKGGHLVIIRSIKERKWLESKLSNTSWIGLTDRAVESEWKWIDGTPLKDSLARWDPIQPDNWKGNEHCVEIYDWNDWNDYDCNVNKHYVCKRCLDCDEMMYNGIKGTCNLQVDVYQEVTEVLFKDRLRAGRIIVIQAKVKPNPTKFVVHLSMGHGKDTPLRIEVDFKAGDLELLTRVGSHVGGTYVSKVVKKDSFPFAAGSNFEMTIECGDIFRLAVGEDYVVNYENDGYDLQDIHRLLVEDDVTVTAVRLI
ncbi:uncharacterized protein LOC130930639 [Corythoichthys intestinalis]|uniref:uncharacterized protein LOC130930639 n=1 Tax=Corythoichthys intestinalis TaxID=161448 RepID=UPI0025A51286|nr:uncharacterized protein LOC130930639 [Corythoichthys intestinalis]